MYSLWSEILTTLFFAFFCVTHVEHVGFVLGNFGVSSYIEVDDYKLQIAYFFISK